MYFMTTFVRGRPIGKVQSHLVYYERRKWRKRREERVREELDGKFKTGR